MEMIFETYLTLKALGFALGLANDPKTDTVKVDREIVKTDLTDTLECDCQGSSRHSGAWNMGRYNGPVIGGIMVA